MRPCGGGTGGRPQSVSHCSAAGHQPDLSTTMYPYHQSNRAPIFQGRVSPMRVALYARVSTHAKQRKLDVILVWKLDRWGRSLVDLMTTLHELTALGVGFVSRTEALDLTTPAGRAFAGFLAVFAGSCTSSVRVNTRGL